MPSFNSLTHTLAARRTTALLLAISLALLALSCWLLQPQTAAANSVAVSLAPDKVKPQAVPGELLVRFRDEKTARRLSQAPLPLALTSGPGAAQIQSFGGSELVAGLRLVRVAAQDLETARAILSARPDVIYAEPNYIWQLQAIPNDPRFNEQWGLRNVGQLPGYSIDSDIDADEAWDITTGNPHVVVGVIDGGIDIYHQDLRDNIWANPGEIPDNNLDDDGNGLVDDLNGWDFYHNDKTVFDNEAGDDHATHVAGILGARGNNNLGATGVIQQVKMMSLKALGPNGGTVANIISAYNYASAMRQRGVNLRVLNNSYGGPARRPPARTIRQSPGRLPLIARAANSLLSRSSMTVLLSPMRRLISASPALTPE